MRLTHLAARDACVLVVASCAVLDEGSVADTGIEPVPLEFEAPAYSAASPEGLLVRSGDDEVVLPRGSSGRWLPDGAALVGFGNTRIELQVVAPATGPVDPPVKGALFEVPGRSVTQVNVLDDAGRNPKLTAYSTKLEKMWSIDLPGTDNPDATAYNELARNYFGVAATFAGATFVQWHDCSEFYEGGDYGVARIEDGQVENVLINERLVALFLSADGTGLLALRQQSGEPCGGCVVDQEIVEVDPETGELTDYGVPDGYQDDWRVEAMDKVGDRVAMRYVAVDGTGGPRSRHLVGTYVYQDGDWKLLEGSDEEIIWWQGADRVVARPRRQESDGRDGYALFWLHDGEATPLPGELEGSFDRRYATGSVAGQLLPRA